MLDRLFGRDPFVAKVPLWGRARLAQGFSDQLLALAIYCANLIVHVALLFYPPARFLYDTDELILTFNCLDRFLGISPTFLSWPSSVLYLLSVPLFLTDYLIRRGLPASQARFLESLSLYLADAYADPRHHVTILRASVAVIASLGPPLLFLIGRRLGATQLISALCALALSLHPSFFDRSLRAAGDSAGLAVICAAICILLYSETSEAMIGAGIFLAMGLAFKLTNLGAMWIAPAIIWFGPREAQRWRRTFQVGAGVIGGFLLWCPYVWTEPLRFAKSVLGNVNKTGSHLDVARFYSQLVDSAGIGFTLFGFVVLAYGALSIRKQNSARLLAAMLAVTVIIATPLLFRASSTYSRYYMPLALPPLLSCALISSGATMETERRYAATILGVLVIAMAVALLLGQINVHGSDDLVEALKNTPTLPSGAKLYMPEDVQSIYVPRLPQSTYMRIRSRALGQLNSGEGLATFLLRNGIPDVAGRVLINDFNEFERANAAHTAAAAESRIDLGEEVFLYRTIETTSMSPVMERTSWADVDLSTAIESFKAEPSAALLVEGNPWPVGAGEPVWKGRTWNWYAK